MSGAWPSAGSSALQTSRSGVLLGPGLLEVSGRTAGPAGHSVMIWIAGRDVHAGHARTGQESRSARVPPGLALPQMAGTMPSRERRKGRPRMPAKDATTESGGFTAEERAAMKARATELRAEGKKGAKKADGLQAVLD